MQQLHQRGSHHTNEEIGRFSNRSAFVPVLLAAIGIVGGCERAVTEKVEQTPRASVSEILAQPEKFYGQELRIDLTPQFRRDDSSIIWHGDFHQLELSIRYALTDAEGKTIEMIDSRRINLNGGARTPASGSAASRYYLGENTVSVVGTVTKYTDADRPYISYSMSLYDPKK